MYEDATEALRGKLDPGNKVLAGQDFTHTTQGEAEPVANFIRRLERVFQVAYGCANMSTETKEAILYGQLREGLRMEILHGPAVSGALGYRELCTAAKNEEQKLLELKKRQSYFRQQAGTTVKTPSSTPSSKNSENVRPARSGVICHNCNKPGHFARDCRSKKKV